MTLTGDLLVEATGCGRSIADHLAPELDAAMKRFSINTPLRAAHFLAQIAYESGLFVRVSENLNYSAPRLIVVFPKYFGPGKADPNEYAMRPDRIANLVYANRLGNGDEDSGDGWHFRGRGFIQLTGKQNYTAFSQDSMTSALAAPDYLTTSEGASLSAAWYWGGHGCNAAADLNSAELVTRRVNGGFNGLAERIAHTKHALEAFGLGDS